MLSNCSLFGRVMSDASDPYCKELPLSGQRLALVGRLSGMTRVEARKLILSKGGQIVDGRQDRPTLIVIGQS